MNNQVLEHSIFYNKFLMIQYIVSYTNTMIIIHINSHNTYQISKIDKKIYEREREREKCTLPKHSCAPH